ncbi:hypothetical protein KCTCHS21_01730 [Cohnella abietis]|uniref:Lipoprotein n=1 Tax=Cohnella abietis TaxID=2507935 RepID=A0A3T1CY64_9BACL|nr:hypothetical protein KCTCHS21_01730 [Cohnella abietis]
MKVIRFFLVILAFLVFIVGCSKDVPFRELIKNSDEVLIRHDNFEKKITDKDKVLSLVNVLDKSNPIEPPDRAKGINLEVAKETIMIHFDRADFFYIGDGYLLYVGQYYSVSKDIEKYIN